MKREPIDFHAVSVAHEQIHQRLEDWAKWCKPPPRSDISPMFRQCRSNEAAVDEEGVRQSSVVRSINVLECRAIEDAVRDMDVNTETKKPARALRWAYVTRRSPVMACRSIGCTIVELAQHVEQGRQELIDRGLLTQKKTYV